MNKTYRNVWCAKTGTFIAAAETARAKGKSARSGLRALSCAALLSLGGGLADAAYAGAMDGGSTVGGVAADIAYGNGANTTNAAGGKAAVAIGQNASANNLSGATPNADGTVAVGDSANATDGGVAVGGASYAASMATAVGAGATAATANSVALGANSVANSTTLGTAGFAPVGGTAIAGAKAAGEVSVGRAGAERRITNVAAGLNSTDAVNVSQLMAEDAKLNSIITGGAGIKYFHTNSTLADSLAIGTDSIAIGGNTRTDAANAISIGTGRLQGGSNVGAIAIGQNANVHSYGVNSVAIGYASETGGIGGAMALGENAFSYANKMVAIGSGASATTANSVALGSGSTTTTNLSAVAYNPGSGTIAGTAQATNGEVSVGKSGGERRVTNVAAGSAATDAVNVSQLMSEDAKVNDVINNVSNISSSLNTLSSSVSDVNRYFKASGAKDGSDDAVNNGAMAIGAKSKSGNTYDVAIGPGALADSTSGGGTNPINSAMAIGYLAQATVGSSTAVGLGSVASGTGSMATGRFSMATGAYSTALGGRNLAQADNSVALGTRSLADRANTVSVGADTSFTDASGQTQVASTRQIVNVGAGTQANDAVNVSQLAPLVNALGGGATIDATTGAVTGPTYVVNGNTITNMGGAITNIDARTTQNTNAITTIDARTTQIAGDVTNLDARTTQIASDVTNLDARTTQMSSEITNLTTSITNGEFGLVQQDATTRNITVAANTDGATVDFSGTAGARKLTGVLAGNVSASSVDAVNGSQLFNVANSMASAVGGGSTVNSDGSISKPGYVIGGTTVNNIAGAITNIDARTTQLANDVTNLTTSISNGGLGLVEQDATTRNITVAKAADGSIVDFTGTAGARKLTGVLAGDVNASSVDAVNGSQLYSLANSTASAIGGGSTVNIDGSVSVPSYVIGGATVNSIGGAITNIDARTTQNAAEISSINTALTNITAGGVSSKYFHTNSTQVDSQATGSESVAIGGAAVATGDNSVALGANSIADRANSVSIGSMGAERQITNVAAGTADTDAVNVAQMNSALASVANIAANAGTGTGSPTFAANGDGDSAPAKATGHHATAMGSNSQASADNSVAIGADSVADRENTVSIGTKGKERQITNVAAGTQGTDAVNVDQLNETVAGAVGNLPAGVSAKDYTDQRFNSMQNSVNQVAKNAYAGVAAAMAMPNMTPSKPGNTVVAGGAGSYKSGAALGVGATYRSRDSKWLVNGAVSVTSTGDAGVRAQVGYEF